MKIKLHIAGYNYAVALIRANKIDFGDRIIYPTDYMINDQITFKGFGAHSQWHLGQDDDIAENNTRSKWLYCFSSDLTWVSRALLVQIKEQAKTTGADEIAEKAEELIGMIDQKQMSVQFGSVSIAANMPADKKGWKWDVIVIQAGETLTNPPMYVPTTALHASLDVFDGVKVYANSVADKNGHKSNRNEKVPGDIVATLSKPYVNGDKMHALMTILPSAQWLRDNLLVLNEENLIDTVYQLSVDSAVDAKRSFVAALNKTLPVVNRIVKADVDIVGEAAAGGRINKLAASKSNPNNNPQSQKGVTAMLLKMLSLLTLFPLLQAGKTMEDWNKVQENELYSHLFQAGKGFLPDSLPDGLTETNVDALTASYINNAGKLKDAKFENGLIVLQAAKPPANPANPPAKNPIQFDSEDAKKLQAAIDENKKATDALIKNQCATLLTSATQELPVPLRDSLRKRFKDKTFTVEELQASIDEGREMLAPFMQKFPHNGGLDIKPGMDSVDKLQAAADIFFLASSQGLNPLKAGTDEYKKISKGVDGIRSIKELYILCTGDRNVTGYQDRNARLTASLETSDFANITLDAMHKRLVRDYLAMDLNQWRAIATLRDGVTDFKNQKFVRMGGYTDLVAVAEGAPYLPVTSPDDEKGEWAPSKRGGTEDLTRELILNDDVSAVQKIPTKMARAAARTLYKFVFDFIRPGVNPAIYDGKALYHVDHANTGTAALASDGVALAAARLRMKKQAELSNSERIGVRAGLLIVPSDLEQIAYGLLTPAFGKSNTIPEYLQQIGVIPLVVPYWADATDWVLAARREDCEMVEVGFVNGQETPELFVSDLPNAGSFFTHDKITYKIRHEYGGAVVDWRGLDGSIVAA